MGRISHYLFYLLRARKRRPAASNMGGRTEDGRRDDLQNHMRAERTRVLRSTVWELTWATLPLNSTGTSRKGWEDRRGRLDIFVFDLVCQLCLPVCNLASWEMAYHSHWDLELWVVLRWLWKHKEYAGIAFQIFDARQKQSRDRKHSYNNIRVESKKQNIRLLLPEVSPLIWCN